MRKGKEDINARRKTVHKVNLAISFCFSEYDQTNMIKGNSLRPTENNDKTVLWCMLADVFLLAIIEKVS